MKKILAQNDYQNFAFSGRVKLINEIIQLSWVNSGFKFKTNAKKLIINLGEFIILRDVTPGVAFKLILNGKEKTYFFDKHNETLEVELPDDITEIEVIRLTDPEWVLQIKNITLIGESVELYKVFNEYKGKILYIGDSLTTGFANLANWDMENYNPLLTDSTKGYAYLVAKRLGYDLQTQSYSGKGIWLTWDGKETGPVMKDLFDSLTPFNHDYNLNAFVPDVVVINALTNDGGRFIEDNRSYDTLKIKIIELLDAVRKAYPNAKIVWHFSVVLSHLIPFVKEVVKEYSLKDDKVYIFDANPIDPDETHGERGGAWHPSVKADLRLADELYNFLISII